MARTCEGSEFLPYWKTERFAFHSLMVAVRRHGTVGSETKDIIAQGNWKSQSVSIPDIPKNDSNRAM